MKLPHIYVIFSSAAFLAVSGPLVAQVPALPASAVPASQTAAANSAAKLACAESDYHFGKVMEGTLVKHTFVVSNTGNEDLVISAVRPGCHCTTAGDWTHTVPPGKTGTIAIQLNSSGMRGEIVRTIAVTSNDKNAPQQTFYLRGSVWKAVEVSPQFAYLNIMPDAISNTSTTVHITSQVDEPLTLSEPHSSNPAFHTELKTIKPGKEYEMIVTAQPPLSPGNNSGTISLTTSLTNMPQINVTAVAMLQPAISLTPAQIVLPTQVARQFTNTVTLTANGAKPLNILNASYCCNTNVTVQIEPLSAGRAYRVITVFPPGFQLGTNQQTEVTIKTDSTSNPLVIVPVRQYYPIPHHPRSVSMNPPPPLPGTVAAKH